MEDALPGGTSLSTAFELRAAAPAEPLMQTLAELLCRPQTDGDAADEPTNRAADDEAKIAAVRAVILTTKGIEEAVWGAAAAAHPEEGISSDEKLLEKPSTLSERGALLVRVRLSRRRLLCSLRDTMQHVVDTYDTGDVKGAMAALETALSGATPSTYPALDELPIEELEAWAGREWDWKSAVGSWVEDDETPPERG